MSRLWLRLSLGFAAAMLAGVFVAGVLVNREVGLRFRRFVTEAELAGHAPPGEQRGELAARLADFHRAHGSWAGVSALVEDPSAQRGPGEPDPVIIADANGHIVYGGAGALTRRDRRAARPVVNDSGAIVGYVVVRPTLLARLPAPAAVFLHELNRSLLTAGLVAAGLGVVLGLVIARELTAPLQRLTAAAREIARGDFSQRVVEEGTREVHDLAHAFNEMAVNLDLAQRLRRDMAADIAHELRTPLTVIQGNLRALLDGVYPLDAAEVALVYNEALGMGRLVQDLADLANAEAGELMLELGPLDVGALAESVVAAHRETEQAQGKTLSCAAEPQCVAQVDPQRLRQVLHNLVGNAVRHARHRVDVAVASEPDESVLVRVRDDGPGIAPESLDRVFERFWQADVVRARADGGSGLGLAIARSLVEAQGGTIAVESTVGAGTTFAVRLPVGTGAAGQG